MQQNELADLYVLLRADGDQIMDARSKLSLSTSLLQKVNRKLVSMMPYGLICSYEMLQNSTLLETIDLQILYNIVEKALGLKLFNDYNISEQVDLHFFSSLKLLEVHRLSVHFLKGLKALRSQLEFVICMRSVETLKDILELCGADRAQGYVWSELKQAVFSHNWLNSLDASLEFTPGLQTLDLSYNFIRNIESLNYLTNLRHLNLANNKIEVLPKLSSLTKLQSLNLRNNFIEKVENLNGLTNLECLDISCNCLIYFDTLGSLNLLYKLKKLSLQGNPLSYHKFYRSLVCKHLHSNITSFKDFTLDSKCLISVETRLVDTFVANREYVMESSGSLNSLSDATVILVDGRRDFPSSGSFQSCTTANTVIEPAKHFEQTSDMEVSSTSIETSKFVEGITHQVDVTRILEIGMQDSGIVTGPRPVSPIDSIGSATSIHDDECLQISNVKRYSGSDIEILSNPSQSSIEVLSDNTPKCVQSTIVLPTNLSSMCPDEELKKVGEEMHRSL